MRKKADALERVKKKRSVTSNFTEDPSGDGAHEPKSIGGPGTEMSQKTKEGRANRLNQCKRKRKGENAVNYRGNGPLESTSSGNKVN